MTGSMEPLKFKTVTVRCNDSNCNFVGNYHDTTIESVHATRNLMSKIPLVCAEDCNHLDYSVETKN